MHIFPPEMEKGNIRKQVYSLVSRYPCNCVFQSFVCVLHACSCFVNLCHRTPPHPHLSIGPSLRRSRGRTCSFTFCLLIQWQIFACACGKMATLLKQICLCLKEIYLTIKVLNQGVLFIKLLHHLPHTSINLHDICKPIKIHEVYAFQETLPNS